ncbi:hypothetical protein KKB43_05340 [Patescibacteria group bacterium]|nr:hypothetical protein [Patescibacteria group bacterium]MBU4580410.1 hypothetical protein [Patescibacteria group bacterium]
MKFKEKIIQYWLTFVLTFIGFSKTLIIVPVFLQIDVYNKYLVSIVNFIFTPAVYASDFLTKWFIFSSFQAGAPILLFNPLIVIVKLAIIAGESYILAWFFVFILKRESTRNLFFRYFYIIKERLKTIGGKILSRIGIKDERYRIPAIIIIVLFFSAFGYLFFDNYSINTGSLPNNSNGGSKKTIDLSGLLHSRDDRRIINLDFYSQALEDYLKNNEKYPIAEETEKISDENSNIFQILKNGGYIAESYKDPSGGDKYYGYKSDGVSYELSAVLEDNKDSRCNIEGNYCVYRLKKEIPKCEFPADIAGLSRKSTMVDTTTFQGKEVNWGADREVAARYQFAKNPDASYVDIYVLNFKNEANAKKYVEEFDKSQECEISGIKGRCVKWLKGQVYNSMARGMVFVWREFKTAKYVSVLEQGIVQAENLLQKKAEDHAIFFTSQFKNCKLQDKY